MIISSIGNGGNLAKTNISTSNASVNNAEINNNKPNIGIVFNNCEVFRSKDRKVKEGNDLKKKEPETPSTKKSSRSNLSKIRSLLNISLKIRKGKKIPKPLERLEESIVEDGELGKRPSGKLKIKSDNGVNQTDSILPLDRTQSDFTRQETRTAKEIPASLPLPPPNESTYIFGDDLTQGTAVCFN
ncbi:hypothetical protein LOAG_08763 [Loa loa]|uniref:Uncharacterized protein n=1 Tax=Loa loa TaxID=7209 RepID=A0A1S0TTT9_LOALO|nr:hypothetical protein LOAG_08763 [Loa loa]EFO19730.2 hypothetical protein LOAG_08763 [Loa loa]